MGQRPQEHACAGSGWCAGWRKGAEAGGTVRRPGQRPRTGGSPQSRAGLRAGCRSGGEGPGQAPETVPCGPSISCLEHLLSTRRCVRKLGSLGASRGAGGGQTAGGQGQGPPVGPSLLPASRFGDVNLGGHGARPLIPSPALHRGPWGHGTRRKWVISAESQARRSSQSRAEGLRASVNNSSWITVPSIVPGTGINQCTSQTPSSRRT